MPPTSEMSKKTPIPTPDYTFEVPGSPKAQGRPRFARIGKFVRTYDPKESRDWKSRVALFATAAGVKPIEGPVSLEVTVFMERPKSLMRARDADGPVYAPKRPDWDNYAKGVQDGLQGIAWRDDGQVVQAVVTKLYHAKHGQPGIRVRVRAVT